MDDRSDLPLLKGLLFYWSFGYIQSTCLLLLCIVTEVERLKDVRKLNCSFNDLHCVCIITFGPLSFCLCRNPVSLVMFLAVFVPVICSSWFFSLIGTFLVGICSWEGWSCLVQLECCFCWFVENCGSFICHYHDSICEHFIVKLCHLGIANVWCSTYRCWSVQYWSEC